jgi:hypothetical protein
MSFPLEKSASSILFVWLFLCSAAYAQPSTSVVAFQGRVTLSSGSRLRMRLTK